MQRLSEFTLIVLILLAVAMPALPGSFSDVGTHYSASWTKTVRAPRDVAAPINPYLSYDENLNNFIASLGALAHYDTVVLQVFGGRESANVAAFLSTIQEDGGAGYREHMKAKAALTRGQLNIYWQIGNEINNGPKLSPSIHAWLGDGLIGYANDQSVIPTLAEMWIGPAVQGLREGDPEARIILGSVVGSSTASTIFSAALLDYQLLGTYAPALAGKRVFEIVTMGSVHYSLASSNWRAAYDPYTTRGLDVWSTEEVGGGGAEAGLCMSGMIKAIGRALSANTRVFVWGAWAGEPTCDQWMPFISSLIGDGVLIPVSATANGVGLEVWSYRMEGGATVSFVSAPAGGTLIGTDKIAAAYIFRAGSVEITSIGTITEPITLGALDAVLIIEN